MTVRLKDIIEAKFYPAFYVFECVEIDYFVKQPKSGMCKFPNPVEAIYRSDDIEGLYMTQRSDGVSFNQQIFKDDSDEPADKEDLQKAVNEIFGTEDTKLS